MTADVGAQRIELTTWESTELLRTRAVGRLCVIDHGYPLAIPINYQVLGSKEDIRLVVRTAPQTILGRYEGPASLEVDDIDLEHGKAWSVIVRGGLRRVTQSPDLPDPHPLLVDGRQLWVVLTLTAISGRRFVIHRAADGFSVGWQLASA
jgi:hypothetical protein